MATSPQQAKSAASGFPWGRLWFLLGALVVYRIGAHIPVPGIDANTLAELFKQNQGGILGMFNMFSGGAMSRFAKIGERRVGKECIPPCRSRWSPYH